MCMDGFVCRLREDLQKTLACVARGTQDSVRRYCRLLLTVLYVDVAERSDLVTQQRSSFHAWTCQPDLLS
jgi:hypothetical protein